MASETRAFYLCDKYILKFAQPEKQLQFMGCTASALFVFGFKFRLLKKSLDSDSNVIGRNGSNSGSDTSRFAGSRC